MLIAVAIISLFQQATGSASPSEDLSEIESLRRAAKKELLAGNLVSASADLPFPDEPAGPSWYRTELERFEGDVGKLVALEGAERELVISDLRLHEGSSAGELDAADTRLSALLGHENPLPIELRVRRSGALARLGRYQEAIDDARAAATRAATPVQHALRLRWLGQLLADAGLSSEAQLELQRASAIWEELGVGQLGVFGYPALLTTAGLASAFEAGGDYASAEPLRMEHLKGTSALLGESDPQVTIAMHNLAVNLHEQGEGGRAFPLIQESIARKIRILGPDHHWVAYGWLQLGSQYIYAGRVIPALDAYEKALAIFLEVDGVESTRVAWTRYRIAEAMPATGDGRRGVEAAEQAWASAQVAFAELPYERNLVRGILGANLREAGELEQSLFVLNEVVEAQRDLLGEEHRVLAHACIRAAEVQELLGRWDAARESLEYAMSILERTEDGGSAYLTGALHGLGRVLAARGDLLASEQALERAGSSLDRDRARHELRLDRSGATPSPYRDLSAVRAQRGDPVGAWTAWDKARGRAQLSLLEAGGSRLVSGRKAEIAALSERLRTLNEQSEGEEVRQAIAETSARRMALEAEVSWAASFGARDVFELSRIQEALDDDEAIVTWCYGLAEHGSQALLYAGVLRAKGAPVWKRVESAERLLPLAESTIDYLQEEARSPFASEASSDYLADADALGLLLFGALEPSGALEHIRHLVIVPGAIEGLPIEALRIDNGWIDERWTLSYAGSSSIFALLRERGAVARADGGLFALGDPPFGQDDTKGLVARRSVTGKLDRLPRSGDEVRAVSKHFDKAHVLLGSDASEANVRKLVSSGALEQFSVLHFATHALVDASRSERSGVVLSQLGLPDAFDAAMRGETAADGYLSMAEVVSEWQLDADLVVLSACRTALGSMTADEGFIGLATAFQQVGARSLIVSLWEVEDAAALRLMTEFYAAWRNPSAKARPRRAKAEALQHARAELRALGGSMQHPSRWAAFTLLGEPR